MKKTTTFIIVSIILINSSLSSADNAFAVIAQTGLSFVNPEIASLVNKAVCVSNPAACLQGKIVGQMTGTALNKVAEINPAAAEAITTYNKVKGYIDSGARIIDELSVDSDGRIVNGIIEFNNEEKIGDLVGENIDKDSVIVNKVHLSKEGDVNRVVFNGRKGYLRVAIKDEKTGKVRGGLYSNIQPGGHISLDEDGNVFDADITANENGGSYNFGDKIVTVPANTRVIFDYGVITVLGEGTIFHLDQALQEGVMDLGDISILDGGERVRVVGNTILGKRFTAGNAIVSGIDW